MKVLFKNQLQFYALPAPEQQTILPVSMRKTGFDLWEGLLVTAFPLQALTEFFIGNCSYFELNAEVEGFNEIKRQICGELYKACFPFVKALIGKRNYLFVKLGRHRSWQYALFGKCFEIKQKKHSSFMAGNRLNLR